MAYNKGYNHIGKGRFFTNYVAWHETIQPLGNFYLIDKTVVDNYTIGGGQPWESSYGQYAQDGIFADSMQNRKVRQVFTDCNPSAYRTLTMPSENFVFEWNMFDRHANCPTIDMNINDTRQPFWMTRVEKMINSCIIFYNMNGVSYLSTRQNGMAWYVEFRCADWDSSTDTYSLNQRIVRPWNNGDGSPTADEGLSIDAEPFLNCQPEYVESDDGELYGGFAQVHKAGAGVIGFKFNFSASIHNIAHAITSIRVGFINNSGVSGNVFTNKPIGISGIWLGNYFDSFISPNVDLDYYVEYDGIKRKNSISGKTHSTLHFLGSPMSDGFTKQSFNVLKINDYAGAAFNESGMTYLGPTNLGRKNWDFKFNSVPGEYLFPMHDTYGWDGNYYGEVTPSQVIPSGYIESNDANNAEGTHIGGQSRYMTNLFTVLRQTANGHLPVIWCQDVDNKNSTYADGGPNNSGNYWYPNCIFPDMFHVVRFKEYPKFKQIVPRFWDCVYSLEETW